jgi:hypothetical protein
MSNFNFADYERKIANKTATAIDSGASVGSGKYSVGIVCSKSNGKRVTLTAALATKLKIKDVMYVTAYREDGIIIFGATAYNDDSTRITVTGDDKKIAYNSTLVHFLIDTFQLDFSNCVSRSCHDITFNNDPKNPMAVLCFGQGKAMDPAAEVSTEDGNEEETDN